MKSIEIFSQVRDGFNEAVKNGDLNKLKEIYQTVVGEEQRKSLAEQGFECAFKERRIEVMHWLLSNKYVTLEDGSVILDYNSLSDYFIYTFEKLDWNFINQFWQMLADANISQKDVLSHIDLTDLIASFEDNEVYNFATVKWLYEKYKQFGLADSFNHITYLNTFPFLGDYAGFTQFFDLLVADGVYLLNPNKTELSIHLIAATRYGRHDLMERYLAICPEHIASNVDNLYDLLPYDDKFRDEYTVDLVKKMLAEYNNVTSPLRHRVEYLRGNLITRKEDRERVLALKSRGITDQYRHALTIADAMVKKSLTKMDYYRIRECIANDTQFYHPHLKEDLIRYLTKCMDQGLFDGAQVITRKALTNEDLLIKPLVAILEDFAYLTPEELRQEQEKDRSSSSSSSSTSSIGDTEREQEMPKVQEKLAVLVPQYFKGQIPEPTQGNIIDPLLDSGSGTFQVGSTSVVPPFANSSSSLDNHFSTCMHTILEHGIVEICKTAKNYGVKISPEVSERLKSSIDAMSESPVQPSQVSKAKRPKRKRGKEEEGAESEISEHESEAEKPQEDSNAGSIAKKAKKEIGSTPVVPPFANSSSSLDNQLSTSMQIIIEQTIVGILKTAKNSGVKISPEVNVRLKSLLNEISDSPAQPSQVSKARRPKRKAGKEEEGAESEMSEHESEGEKAKAAKKEGQPNPSSRNR